MEKLKKLMNLCEAEVMLDINEHRGSYQTVEEYLEDLSKLECPPEIEDSIKKIMIETDTMVCCIFYPDSPVGSYLVYHYDLDKCLDICLAILKE